MCKCVFHQVDIVVNVSRICRGPEGGAAMEPCGPRGTGNASPASVRAQTGHASSVITIHPQQSHNPTRANLLPINPNEINLERKTLAVGRIS